VTINGQILESYGPGRIYAMEACNDKTMIRVKINGSPNSKDFHPHGLGVINSPNNNAHLVYLINHRSDGDFVEIYEYRPDTHSLLWMQEIRNAEFVLLNDVEPVWTRENSKVPDFFVTNSFKYEMMTWKNLLLEGFYHPRWNTLLHCGLDASKDQKNPWSCTVVDDTLAMSNGVAASADGRHLYAISTDTKTMMIYNLSLPSSAKSSNPLIKKWKVISTPSSCDNFYVDQSTGEVFVACHPDQWRLRKRIFLSKDQKEPGNAAPSQVLKWEGNEDWRVIFSCSGDDPCIEGSSTGVYCKDTNTLLIGTVVDNGIGQCQLKL